MRSASARRHEDLRAAGPPAGGDKYCPARMALSQEALEGLGPAAVGTDVVVHETALFFGAAHVHIGSHVRIDAFAIVTAGPGDVHIGDRVHIGAAAQVFGTAGVRLEDFSGVSPRVTIFSASDDYVEGHLTNPTVPAELRKVVQAPVTVGRHVIVGAGSVVLPRSEERRVGKEGRS